MRLMDDDNVYMPKADFNRLSKYALKENDLLVSVVGTIGSTAIVESADLPAVFSCKSTVVRVKGVNPRYLLTYLNTEVGQSLLRRKERGAVQQGLNLEDLKSLGVYLASGEFQKRVGEAYAGAVSARGLAKSEFMKASDLLLKAIGMQGVSFAAKAVNIRSFSSSLAVSGRLDAEHYQPKYEALYKALSASNRVFRLGERLSFNQRGSQPDYADTGLRVINSKHVQRGDVLIDDTRFAVLPDKANAVFIEQDDVLMNGTGVGTIGRAAPYLYKQRALPDNHVTVLRTDAMSPICLALYLNSIAGQMQVDQHFKGSSGQIELYPADIANFWCPEIAKSMQKKIDALAQSSFELKAKSERLLEAAKRAVEIAIEQDEAAGMAYLTRESSSE